MAVAQMARGSCCGAFEGFKAWRTAVSKAGKTRWLSPKWLVGATAEPLKGLRLANGSLEGE